MESKLPPEREISLSQALARIDAQLAALSLKVEERQLGAAIGSVLVKLEASTGCTARGSGKGTLAEATVGARFEALEHYLDEHHQRHWVIRESTELAADLRLKDDFLQPWLLEQPDTRLACQRYLTADGQSLFDYPIGVTRPDYAQASLPGDTFNYDGLRRYSSNDGSAIGASRSEAVLHALNQLIERDALSLFMLRHFYFQRPDTLHRVIKPADDSDLSMLWEQAERQLGASIAVLDISSEFASRTYLAWCPHSPHRLHEGLTGSGAALDPRHGIRRAISELVQMCLNARVPAAALELQEAELQLRSWPRLHRCLQLQLTPLLETTVMDIVLPTPMARVPVTEQVQTVLQDLHQHGRVAGICEVFRGDQGISFVNVVVPGLERFHLVSSGNVVLPHARGMQLAPA
ncbi:YcaO-like family protein [Pseudomonas sp. NPDC089752]|uniref:YcaO-like family protein n=1 Tax=Pseudomonas sp. NPDC089752 TaxID=3364472 RepID=UPI003802E016